MPTSQELRELLIVRCQQIGASIQASDPDLWARLQTEAARKGGLSHEIVSASPSGKKGEVFLTLNQAGEVTEAAISTLAPDQSSRQVLNMTPSWASQVLLLCQSNYGPDGAAGTNNLVRVIEGDLGLETRAVVSFYPSAEAKAGQGIYSIDITATYDGNGQGKTISLCVSPQRSDDLMFKEETAWGFVKGGKSVFYPTGDPREPQTKVAVTVQPEARDGLLDLTVEVTASDGSSLKHEASFPETVNFDSLLSRQPFNLASPGQLVLVKK
ncbi:hypothetical protein A2160_01240 [Candidatus Beckwithbacteria bacterium RBG_13_42_9]|uniref:Uncharacterized protein n=1 Tax=Candidatus Beckwithbacteria bacterium RBG_13_42_9 TaxID=1797457 RepID=A0A1F5E4A9_9BACT|nr:MAG: hypothetical protein A2160_01240 [Candidatus Beckwithbacteria bacterium RBG_13_42_9]